MVLVVVVNDNYWFEFAAAAQRLVSPATSTWEDRDDRKTANMMVFLLCLVMFSKIGLIR
jgi:hypothetical protein